MTSAQDGLPLPPHFEPDRVGEVWRVDYERRASEALEWGQATRLGPSATDGLRIGLLLIDVQNTFCIPGFELFVSGRSGTGAVDDNRRLCAFLYRNLGRITEVCATLDTHTAIQIFHASFFVNEGGAHPGPYTQVTRDDVATGRWRFNPAAMAGAGAQGRDMARYLEHYTRSLEESGRFALTVWPYHAMLGGIGHALVSAVEEAVFFHTVGRSSQPIFHLKGANPLAERYSALAPEVRRDETGQPVDPVDTDFMDRLLGYDALVVAGQAQSHCVRWTVEDVLARIEDSEAGAAERVYLLQDCTSPVVVAGGIDYTDDAAAAFERFRDAGVHLVSSITPIEDWPGNL